jgi:NSS family neurotransmitter:Na+ symporter
MDTREYWSSRLAFILVTVGSAVGLGNIWRFPYLVGVNGGGAFLIPYLLGILICGLPILMIELAGGRRFGGGVVATFGAIRHSTRWIGVMVALCSLVLLSYYLVVAGWALGYVASSITGALPSFAAFTAGYNSVLFFLLFLTVTGGVVALGVRGGIEAASRLLMPLLFLMLVGLAMYSLSLDGWGAGMQFYLAPRLSSLKDPLVWVAAFGQGFFSVGVGMGVMITYGSYLHPREAIASSTVLIVLADVLAAFVAGMVIFPIVFSFGGEPAAGPQLAFDTLPMVFQHFPRLVGATIATILYVLLSIAALTSAISLFETVLVALTEVMGISRRSGLVWLLCALTFLGLPNALSYTPLKLRLYGYAVLDAMDTITGIILLPLGVLITAIVLGWLGPTHLLEQAIKPGFVGQSCLILVRLAVPTAVLAVLMTTIIQYVWIR